jgi:hypothetical protein
MVGANTYCFLKSSVFVRGEEGKALDSAGLERRKKGGNAGSSHKKLFLVLLLQDDVTAY